MVTTRFDSGPLKGDVLTTRLAEKDEVIPFESAEKWYNYDKYVAVVRGKILGYCVVNKFQLKHIEVEQGFRRNKIGTMLIATSKVQHTMVCETDLQAQMFLKSCDFVCYDIIKHGPNAGHNGYLFEVPEYDSSSK